MTADELRDLLREIHREARDADVVAIHGYECAMARGVIYSYFVSLWDALPEDDFLKNYVPEKLAEDLDAIKQRAVMKKLES
jgi:hypothetical protein